MVTDEEGGEGTWKRRDGCADRRELGEKEVIGRMKRLGWGDLLPGQERRGREVK